MRIDVSELESFAEDLRAASSQTRKAVGQVVRATTQATEDGARRRAPVRTGRLRDSVRSRVRGLSGRVEATAPHAPLVEYGTAFMDPQPFLAPAAEAEERQFYRDAEDSVLETARRVLG